MSSEYARLAAQHSLSPYRWWWLSFSRNDEFVGVCVVRGRFLLEACAAAAALPGVLIDTVNLVGQEASDEVGPPPAWAINHLITDPEEVTRAAMEWTGAGTETLEENEKRSRS